MMIKDILACALLALGLCTYIVSVVGMFKFDYVLNRMHAAGMADSLGILLIVLAGSLFYWDLFPVVKLIFILVLCWVLAPVSTHLIARVEMLTNRHLDDHLSGAPGDKEAN